MPSPPKSKGYRTKGERSWDRVTIISALVLVVVIAWSGYYTVSHGVQESSKLIGELAAFGLLVVLNMSIIGHIRRVLARDHSALIQHVNEQAAEGRAFLVAIFSGQLQVLEKVQEFHNGNQDPPQSDSPPPRAPIGDEKLYEALYDEHLNKVMKQALSKVLEQIETDDDEGDDEK